MQYQNHLSLRLGAIWHRENGQIVATTLDLIGYDSQLRSPDPLTISRESQFQSKSGNLGCQVQSAAIGLRGGGAHETRTAFLPHRGTQRDAIHLYLAGGSAA